MKEFCKDGTGSCWEFDFDVDLQHIKKYAFYMDL